MDLRVGTGIDFHRLTENPDRPLLLGGFEIPGALALEGHSDADILFHALADAVYGALGLGDIGYYFPDTRQENRNLNSAVIIQAALRAAAERGFRTVNADITLIGEVPKVNPYRESVRRSVCEITGIPAERIGIKATTVEKMGAIGRKEGIACIATVLLMKKM